MILSSRNLTEIDKGLSYTGLGVSVVEFPSKVSESN
jgi:hypothetical protein